MSLTVSVQVNGDFVGWVQTAAPDFGGERARPLVQKLQLRNMHVTELTRCVTSVVGEAPSPDESDHE
ncbi:hypothetical protein ARTHRO9V_210038 [Arthrobacter sp. 9V]|nr:hypothetical protein ARTHRO9V_210038 [Arthrobacter sp. 9V]